MKVLLGSLVLAGSLLLGGCATTSSVSTPAYVQKLPGMGVTPGTVARIKAGRVLAFSDVLNLVRSGVPGDKIVAYLRSTRASYDYSTAQVNTLVAAGADSILANYVGRSAGDFLIDAQNAQQQSELRQNAKWRKEAWNDPYFTDFDYFGGAPFPYEFPEEWE